MAPPLADIVAVIYLEGSSDRTGDNIVYAAAPPAEVIMELVAEQEIFRVSDQWGQAEQINPRYVKRVKAVVR